MKVFFEDYQLWFWFIISNKSRQKSLSFCTTYDFTFCYGQIKFCCVYVLHFIYPFICWWAWWTWPVPSPGYYEWCSNKHWFISILVVKHKSPWIHTYTHTHTHTHTHTYREREREREREGIWVLDWMVLALYSDGNLPRQNWKPDSILTWSQR